MDNIARSIHEHDPPKRAARRARARSRRPLIVRWRRDDRGPEARRRVAQQIAETVLRAPQLDPGAPAVPLSAAAGATAQSRAPISYRDAGVRLAGMHWESLAEGKIGLLLSDGTVAMPVEPRRKAKIAPDRWVREHDRSVAHRRSPMAINNRPGTGGHRRRPIVSALDPTEGLDHLGIVWRTCAGGAHLGTLELNPQGNTYLLLRLSGEDNETLQGQWLPILGMVERFSETLIPRMAIFAVEMSGTREVRHERERELPGGILARDDIHIVFDAIEAGLCQHVVLRDGDRIARDLYPGEIILRHWQRHNVGLWLSTQGRQMDYIRDGMPLRMMMVVSASERENSTRRMQLGSLHKGPIAGNGWVGATRYGFVREPRPSYRLRPEAEAWVWVRRIFGLAASGEYVGEKGLSIRRITEVLASEGFHIGHNRVRTMLKDHIYSTGEFTVKVRGHEIAQRPVEFTPECPPISLDQFQLVQDLLALRRGGTKLTDLGEFALNYVPLEHLQCQGQTNAKGLRSRLRGYVQNERSTRVYRHHPFCPTCCKGRRFSWNRDELDGLVIAELRKLATDPEVMRELTLAARHANSGTDWRLTEEQRGDIEHQIEELEMKLDSFTNQYIDRLVDGDAAENPMEHFERLTAAMTERIARLRTRLANDAALAIADRRSPASKEHDDRTASFLEILSPELPQDIERKQLRARLVQRCVSGVVIDDDGSGGPITVTIEGQLVPPGASMATSNPVLASADLLDAYAARNRPAAQGAEAGGDDVQTDFSQSGEKSVYAALVGVIEQPSNAELEQRRRTVSTSPAHKDQSRLRDPSHLPAWMWRGVASLRGSESGYRRTRDPFRRRRQIMTALREGAKSSGELAAQSGLGRETIQTWIRSLIADGYVTTVYPGRHPRQRYETAPHLTEPQLIAEGLLPKPDDPPESPAPGRPIWNYETALRAVALEISKLAPHRFLNTGNWSRHSAGRRELPSYAAIERISKERGMTGSNFFVVARRIARRLQAHRSSGST